MFFIPQRPVQNGEYQQAQQLRALLRQRQKAKPPAVYRGDCVVGAEQFSVGR